MTALAVVGAQWGDEGKGKVVDLLADRADLVVRFQGGNNAGHTLVVAGRRTVFHLIPSGILRPEVLCVMGQGMVIDPRVLVEELDRLDASGPLDNARLAISDSAHVILPHHLILDRLREESRSGSVPVGSTLRGIGPAYEDKVGRRGVRVGDIFRPEQFARILSATLNHWRPLLEGRGAEVPDVSSVVEETGRLAARFEPCVTDTAGLIHERLEQGARVLLEGAQGALLDVDHGTYPFVTSSNTVSGAACAGAGLGPRHVGGVLAVVKAYTTRVGEGPFPTELPDAVGERLRDAGREFGSTTGRPRRCGWFDAVAARRMTSVNGATSMAVTKLDVLTGIDPIRVCVGYEIGGGPARGFPMRDMDRVTPVYREFAGWNEPLGDIRRERDLPPAARAYVDVLSELAGCPVSLLSVGPGREQTIQVADPFGG